MKASVVVVQRAGRRSKRWSRLHTKLGRAAVVLGLLAPRLFEFASAEPKGAASVIEGVDSVKGRPAASQGHSLTGTELCPVDQFNAAMQMVLTHMPPGTLERAFGSDHAVTKNVEHVYKAMFGHLPCSFGHGPKWPISTKQRHGMPLVICAGQGTTGTRFLACMSRGLGFKTGHNPNWVCHNMTSDCTSKYDRYEVLLDSPILQHLAPLMQAHPGNSSTYMLPLRDPWEWAKSRVSHHLTQGSESWTGAESVCSSNSTRFGPLETIGSNDAVARDYLVEAAWSACLILQGRPKDSLFMFNLFIEDAEHDVKEYFRGLLEKKRATTAFDHHGHHDDHHADDHHHGGQHQAPPKASSLRALRATSPHSSHSSGVEMKETPDESTKLERKVSAVYQKCRAHRR